jgi:aspartate kinase
VIGAALNVPEVQVWKDVDGVLSADPREIDNTAVLEFLTFEEATELAYFGAQVLHPQSMRPAMDKDGLRRGCISHTGPHTTAFAW